MAMTSLDDWGEIEHVNVDLSDVFGIPGIPDPKIVAGNISGAFGGEVTQRGGDQEIFIVGESEQRLTGSSQTKLSSFLQQLDAASAGVDFNPTNATVLATHESLSGTHIVAQQTLRNTEVLGARFRIHLDNGRLYACTGRPVGNLQERDPGEAPSTTDRQAIDAIRSYFKLGKELRIQVARVIFPTPEESIWAWQCRFVLYEPLIDMRAYVRADNHELLLSYNVASAALRGEAQVYPVNPKRTPDLSAVRLDHIGPEPSDRLTGGVVTVKPRVGVAFTQALRDCRLNPKDPGFDEVHAFYHLQNAVRYFEVILDGALLNAAPFAPITAFVRDPQSVGNAYFVPTTGELLFGDFGARPTARSAEIIYHEFAHAVSDTICRLGRGPKDTQARGLSEGYSDYFAASALGDPRIGDYVLNKADGGRRCDKPNLRFPLDFKGKEHALGEVWAGVLWGIRSRCGAGVTDALAIESLQHLVEYPSFDSAHNALITADRVLFPGADGRGRHQDIIDQEFTKRLPEQVSADAVGHSD